VFVRRSNSFLGVSNYDVWPSAPFRRILGLLFFAGFLFVSTFATSFFLRAVLLGDFQPGPLTGPKSVFVIPRVPDPAPLSFRFFDVFHLSNPTVALIFAFPCNTRSRRASYPVQAYNSLPWSRYCPIFPMVRPADPELFYFP